MVTDDKFHLFDSKTTHVEPTTVQPESTNVSLLGISKPGSFGANNSFLKLDSIVSSVKSGTPKESGNFGTGIVKGFFGTAGSLLTAPMAMIAHPVDTINGVAHLGSLALHPTKAFQDVKNYGNKLLHSGGEKGGEMWGSLAVNALMFGEAGSGLYRAGKGLLARSAAADLGEAVTARGSMLGSASEAPVAKLGSAAVSPTERFVANADETLRASAKPATSGATDSFLQELEHKPGGFTVPHNAEIPAGSATNLHITDGVAHPPAIAEQPGAPATHLTVSEPMPQIAPKAPAVEAPSEPFREGAPTRRPDSLLGRLETPPEAPKLGAAEQPKLGAVEPPKVGSVEPPKVGAIGNELPSVSQPAWAEAPRPMDQAPLETQRVRASAGAEPQLTISQPTQDFSVPQTAADARPGQTLNFNPLSDGKAANAGVHINTTETPRLNTEAPRLGASDAMPPNAVTVETPSLSPAQERALQTTQTDVSKQLDTLRAHAGVTPEVTAKIDAAQTELKNVATNPSAANIQRLDQSLADLQKTAAHDTQLANTLSDLRTTTVNDVQTAVRPPAVQPTNLFDNVAASRKLESVSADVNTKIDNLKSLSNDQGFIKRAETVQSDWQKLSAEPSPANYINYQRSLNDLVQSAGSDARLIQPVLELDKTTMAAWRDALPQTATVDAAKLAPVADTTARNLASKLDSAEKLNAGDSQIANQFQQVRSGLNEYLRNPSEANYMQMQTRLNDLQAATAGDAQLSKAVSDFRSSTLDANQTIVEANRTAPLRPIDTTAAGRVDTPVAPAAARDLNAKVDKIEQMATSNPELSAKVNDVRSSLNDYVRNPGEGSFVGLQNKLNDLQNATAGEAQLSQAVSDLKASTTETATKSVADAAAARSGQAVQANITSLTEKMPEQAPAIEGIKQSYDRAAADPNPANLRDLRNRVDGLEQSVPDAQRAVVQNDINALRQNSVGQLSNAGAEQATLRAAAAQSEAASQIGSIEAKTGKISQFEADYNAAAQKVSSAQTEAQFSQAATELDQKLAVWENKLYSDLRDGSLSRDQVQTVRANTNQFIANQEQAILSRSSADTGVLYRDAVATDTAAASDGAIRGNARDTAATATTGANPIESAPKVSPDHLPQTAPGIAETSPRLAETSPRSAVAADTGSPSATLVTDGSRGVNMAPESRASAAAGTTTSEIPGQVGAVGNISSDARFAAADSRVAAGISSSDSPLATAARSSDAAAGFNATSRIEQVTGRTADEVFGSGARTTEVQASADANSMFVPQSPSEFVAATQRFESSAEAYNNMVRDNAPAANLTNAQVGQLSIDTQGTLQAARQQFLNNAWETASASRANLVSVTDSVLKSSNLPTAMASQLDAYVQKIDSLASRYTSAQTDLAQKSAATAIREQVDQLQTQISKSGVVPPVALQQQLTQAVSEFMQNGSIREARAIASGTAGGERSMLGAVTDRIRSAGHVTKQVLSNPWVQAYSAAAVVSHTINEAGQAAKQEAASKPAAPAAQSAATQESKQQDASNAGSRQTAASDRAPSANVAKQADSSQQRAAASHENTDQPVAQQSANFNPSDTAAAPAAAGTAEGSDQSSMARPAAQPGLTMNQLESTSFGSLTSDRAKVLFSMLYSGGQTVAFDVNYRGPGVQQLEADTRPILFSQPRLNVRTDITETQERPTNKAFDWRKTQLSTASLGRRDGHYISNPYADPHSKSLRSTTLAGNPAGTAGGVAQQYPFLMLPKNNSATQTRNVAVAPGAENSERHNPDAISNGAANDPRMQSAASASAQNDPAGSNDEQPQVVAPV